MRFAWLKPKEFGWDWNKTLRVLTVGVYFFAIQIDFGRKWREKLINRIVGKHFGKVCEVCKKFLNVNSLGQIVRFHKDCRKKKNVKKYR